MKYSGVKKVESISMENTNNRVVKQEKKSSNKFFNIMLIQFSICLCLLCAFSITWLFQSDSLAVFNKNKVKEPSIMVFNVHNNVTSCQSGGSNLILKQTNNMVYAIYSGEVTKVDDGEMTIKYDDELYVVYKNLNNCLFRVGDKIDTKTVVALKQANEDVVINLFYKSKLITKYEIDGKCVKWQEK